ncbi:MAG TPA: glycosyltransferase [Gaiellaceae bacterium]|nr:glycosyltransferase [Gaiellaceae bacterium]
MSLWHGFLDGVGLASFVYFGVLNFIYAVFTYIAWSDITRHLRSLGHVDLQEAFASPLTPGVSVLVPAYNEEAGIVESVRSLLALRYPRHEVIVVSDGSTDRTLEALDEAFDLAPVPLVLRDTLVSKSVRATYVSRRDPSLRVLDKENGGKADALNAGARVARHPYICVIDADALVEEDALLRVALPILDDEDLVIATGGIVRIANGCTIDHGRIVDVRLPRNRLAVLQTVEYFRAFLIGRVGWSRARSLLIISGAFGLFRRSLVEAVGGWSTETVGEDVELVLRLHRYLRERDEPYRISFVPDPVCWTEAPETFRALSRQRRRWHTGLAQALWRHRRMIGNPVYGVVGLIALPYFFLFELLGPIAEVLGLGGTIVWWAVGGLSSLFFGVFLMIAFLLAILLSIAALALEEFSFRRHARGREVGRLLAYAVLENIGYRQLNGLWRLRALVELVLRRPVRWGAQERRGIGASSAGT